MKKNINAIEILEMSIATQSFNNQLQILQDKFLDSNIWFHQGHQFTVNEKLIALCKNYLNEQRQSDVILLDDYRLPVLVSNLQEFYDEIWNLYQGNLNSYHTEYNRLIQERGKVQIT